MDQKINLQELEEKIKLIKSTAQELKLMTETFPSINRNASRILASTKMLEINISDLLESGA